MGLRGAKHNPLSKTYAKLAFRRGCAQALKAIAHKLARVIYALFTHRTAYDRSKLEPPKTERAIARMTTRLAHEAKKLCYVLQKTVAQPLAT